MQKHGLALLTAAILFAAPAIAQEVTAGAEVKPAPAPAPVTVVNVEQPKAESKDPNEVSDRSGLYLAGTVGYTVAEDLDGTDAGGTDFTLEMEDGISGTGALGVYAGMFRFEVEGGYRYNEVENGTLDSIFGGIEGFSGDFQSASLMGNVFIDIPVFDRTQIYLGVGAGGAIIWADVKFEPAVGPSSEASEDDTVFAGQAMAGVAYAITDNLTLTLGYRYFMTDDLEFDDDTEVDGQVIHTGELGVRFDF